MRGALAGLVVLFAACEARAQCPDGAVTLPAWMTTTHRASILSRTEFGGAVPPPAPCASPLMRHIHRAVAAVADRGTVPPPLVATSRNVARPAALVQGPRIFRRMSDLIAAADREVLIQNWRWNTQSRGHTTLLQGFRRLAARRRIEKPDGPPVTVHLLVNVRALEDPRMISKLSEELENLRIDPKLVRFEIAGHAHTGLGALHVKTTVVDGVHAITTGANVQKNHDTFGDNYDLGFEFHGEVAYAMRADFANAWKGSTRWTCGGLTDYLDLFGRASSPCWKTNIPLSPSIPHLDPAAERACAPMLVVTRPAEQSPFANDDRNPQNQAYLAALAGARERIRIVTPNLNDRAVKRAIVGALSRGVTVELVTGKGYQDFAERIPTRGGTNHDAFREILQEARKAGVTDPCRLFRPRWYVRREGRPVIGNVDESIHAKYLSVDRQVSIVGSANLDEQSFNNSRELNVVVDDAARTIDWDRQVFEPNFDRGVPIEECGG